MENCQQEIMDVFYPEMSMHSIDISFNLLSKTYNNIRKRIVL
jgi:hypothetical protein